MKQVDDESVHLVVTSPPYWNIKDYGNPRQIGYRDKLTTYIKELGRVWSECFRVLKPGCRLCVNIGDEYVRANESTPYHIVPLHAYLVNDIVTRFGGKKVVYLGSIIWQKISTTRTTGGASVMGSYGYPRNGYVSYNYEYIAIFKKLGPSPKPPGNKQSEKIDLKEWRNLFNGIWYRPLHNKDLERMREVMATNDVWRFHGSRQIGGIAIFPDELPRRLMRMFTFEGDTVLDPFLGTGTTAKVAYEMGRNSIGYEVGFRSNNGEKWRELIKQKVHYYDLPRERRASVFFFGSK
jgi:DNA modification methylase